MSEEEVDDELAPLNVECLQVLLQKLIKEEHYKKIADVLEEEHLITKKKIKRIHKKFEEKKFEDAFEVLIAALKHAGELNQESLERAFQSKEFPAEHHARTLLSHICGEADKDLLFIVKNWDVLDDLKEKLKPLLSDISDDDDWVKELVFAAFEEAVTDSKDKKVLKLVKKELTKPQGEDDEMQPTTEISSPEGDKVLSDQMHDPSVIMGRPNDDNDYGDRTLKSRTHSAEEGHMHGSSIVKKRPIQESGQDATASKRIRDNSAEEGQTSQKGRDTGEQQDSASKNGNTSDSVETTHSGHTVEGQTRQEEQESGGQQDNASKNGNTSHSVVTTHTGHAIAETPKPKPRTKKNRFHASPTSEKNSEEILSREEEGQNSELKGKPDSQSSNSEKGDRGHNIPSSSSTSFEGSQNSRKDDGGHHRKAGQDISKSSQAVIANNRPSGSNHQNDPERNRTNSVDRGGQDGQTVIGNRNAGGLNHQNRSWTENEKKSSGDAGGQDDQTMIGNRNVGGTNHQNRRSWTESEKKSSGDARGQDGQTMIGNRNVGGTNHQNRRSWNESEKKSSGDAGGQGNSDSRQRSPTKKENVGSSNFNRQLSTGKPKTDLPGSSTEHTNAGKASGDEEGQKNVRELSTYPNTRSQVRREEDRHFSFRILTPDALEVPADNEHLLEIRAVVSDLSALRDGVTLCMICEDANWYPIPMALDEKKTYYFLRILFGARHKLSFKYKFCFVFEERIYFEVLPEDRYSPVNRLMYLDNVGGRSAILFNVCLFAHADTWPDICCDGMQKFLPSFEKVTVASEVQAEVDLFPDIFAWVSSMERGWRTDSYVRFIHKPREDEWEKILLNWLKDLIEKSSDETTNSIPKVLPALYLVMSLHAKNHKPVRRELFLTLLTCLQIDSLGEQDCEEFFNLAGKAHQNALENGIRLHTFRHSMHWIYEQISYYPNLDWILTLPLYWLLVHGKVKSEVMKEDPTEEILLSKSSLPSSRPLDWKNVYRKCALTAGVRQGMMELSSLVLKSAELHPWIVRTYQFMLKTSEYTDLVYNDDDIIYHFPVNSALSRYVDGIIGNRLTMTPAIAKKFENYFQKLLDEAIKPSSEPDVPEHKIEADFYTCLNILDSVVKFVRSKRKPDEVKEVIWSVDVILPKTVSWIAALDLKREWMRKINEKLDLFLQSVTNGINRRKVDKEEVEFWGKLLKAKWDLEDFDNRWKELIMREIQNSINNFCSFTKKKEDFLEFYIDELGMIDLHPDIEKCLSEKAYKFTETLLLESQRSGWLSSLSERVKIWKRFSGSTRPRIVPIIEKLFMKEYENERKKTNSIKTTSLLFLCNWSFSVQFFDLFGGEWKESFLSDQRTAVQEVSENFKEIVKSLSAAYVTIEHLKIILKHRQKFLLLCGVFNVNDVGTSVDDSKYSVDDEITNCKKYLDAFEKTKGAVRNFVRICNDLDLNGAVPHEALQRKLRLEPKGVQVRALASRNEENEFESTLYFGITNEQLVELQQMSSMKESKKVLPKMLTDTIDETRAQSNDELKWQDILTAWTTVKNKVIGLVKTIDEGTITVDVVNDQFAVLKGSEEDISCEVNSLYEFCKIYDDSDPAVVLGNERSRKIQIFNVFEARQAERKIEVLLELKEMLGLEGDFTNIVQNKEMFENQGEFRLNQVPEKLKMSAVTSITAEQLHVLEKFMDGKSVISWLQEKMEGMNEVKVMCDLAMITAGENAVEVGKVSCLLSAVMGFAPLIFWNESRKEGMNEETAGSSKPSKKSNNGLRELLAQCKKVFKNASEDDKLLVEWEETNRQLKWFQDVEKFYGSVEKSSLTRAQEINERGVYSISRMLGEHKPTLENSMKLMIPDIDNKESKQTLSLETLRELQSKLMLIAGEADKGQRDVNQFIDVLTAVEKLAEIYVKLQSSGCMLFSGWEATIVCNGAHESSTDNLTIQIVFSNEAPPLSGQGCHTDLDKITEILEESLTKWEEHLADERLKHYFLNEFNINQIIHLCHELSVFEDSDQISDQVYTLLSFVRKEFTEDELRHSLEQAKRDAIFGLDTPREDSDNEASSGDEENADNEEGEEQDNIVREARKYFSAVRTLMAEDDIPEDQAKAAVQENGYQDIAECRVWLLQYQFDDDLIEELSGLFDENYEQYSGRKRAEVLHSAFKENCNNTLKGVISRLQRRTAQRDDTHGTLLDSVATICKGYLDETITMNLQDHLTIGLLGHTLMNLSAKNDIQRKMLPGLRHGKPNILVCGEEEMLPTVLSLYMHNRDQPLPNRSEVLICSDETTKDEVERFIRRALCTCPTQGQLLYTLACADKLSYTNSVAVVDIFNKCCGSVRLNVKYHLVILLSKQQHYLATYFYKHVVDGKWARKTEDISKYLAEQLKVEDLTESAASAVQGHSIVKVVTSTRSGVGKSLYIQRVRESLSVRKDFDTRNVTMRLMENKIDLDYIIRKLCPSERIHNNDTIMAHIDLTPAVQNGIESFIFDLFVLGSIQGSDGKVWKSHTSHLYLVEMTDFGTTGEKRFSNRHILNLLPCVSCYPPLDVLKSGERNITGEWLGMDRIEFQSEIFQRPFQYLLKYEKGEDLDEFRTLKFKEVQFATFPSSKGDENQCIAVLLRHCCINNPSWAQLRHFCSFLNFQLRNCEISVFCNNEYVKPLLTGLKAFAVGFMIKMAQDFATPSLTISDTSTKDAEDNEEFQAHQLRRKWEESFHPYVFFNEDGQTMTFVNVKIDRQGNLLGKNDQIIDKIITPELTTALHQQRIELRKNFDDYSRREKLCFLCQVLGIEIPDNPVIQVEDRYDHRDPFDPDPTYELTTDNVLKILAIYTRFQCGIPVIIMGETGCGKTRLVEFMSKLKAGKVVAPTAKQPDGTELVKKDGGELQNMTTLKIHGGITVRDIHRSVEEAKDMERQQRHHQLHNNFAVLFCDEANTTEAIYAIKEVMCDRSIDGEFFQDSNLKIVAACNPYKKLSKAAIDKLEDSGLGYRIRTSKSAHLFGNIPVRSLVYRVVALPPSMQPFVWDFGQLNDEAEKIYIQQMTKKLAQKLGLNEAQNSLINNVLSHCQQYMRKQTDECRYVSLRDVERCMITFEWFYNKRSIILPMIDDEIRNKKHKQAEPKIGEFIRVLIQTVAVCYHASLDEREPFRTELARSVDVRGVDEERINTEIISCQSAFLRNVRVGKNIARNQALRENVFMMVVCTDMRIPLFLVGKPGSSKSLAKTIVTNNMQGQTSHAKLYKKLKQIHILSYQCSALTDADGIKKVFNQCVQLQKKQNLDTYTAVVVLDEIGLAEDSPNMPLKILHPLLERRSTDLMSVTQEDAETVGFIGISNWALDPAKMNRGIFLTRNRPEEKDLRKTGKEIFQGRNDLWDNNEVLFNELTQTYVEMYNSQKVEYFGLRDYYSLMKMICIRCQNTDEDIDLQDVIYAISRNFGGGDQAVIEKFIERASNSLEDDADYIDNSIPIQRMIQDNLKETESRFLLLLANQFSIVSLLESCIKGFAEGYQVVFGSSFPGDHSYTEICRNINKIKVCMETGRTVILLNMAKIHESLYDALNQHFVTMGKQNFVDLGLGGHRVKCRITNDFRLIVIEKSEVVRREYPIPLINRLEKHHFRSERLLNDQKKTQSQELRDWASNFNPPKSCFTCQHAFIGYHDDTPGSIIFTSVNDEMEQYKTTLLQACPMDAIFRLRDSRLTDEEKKHFQEIYFNKQQHDGLLDVLQVITKQENHFSVLEVTSFSGVLWDKDAEELEKLLNLKSKSITLLSLEQFLTQQEYCNRLDKFFEKCKKQCTSKSPMVLLVQCAQAQLHSSIVACARFSLMNRIRNFHNNLEPGEETKITVALLLSTEREGLNEESSDSLNLQHTTETLILHVDDLHPTDEQISPASKFFNKSLKDIFEAGKKELDDAQNTESFVKIKSLLLDSVAECMTKVIYSGNSERNLERISILMNLCSMDGDIGKHFCKITLSKVVEAFSVIGGRYGEGMDWIVERANDGESLQDAGTFRKALWLCLKGHLSKFLAFIISKIDRNSNLDIISKDKPDPWEMEMWLGMFQRFDIPWAEMLDAPHYVVARSRKTTESCEIPFSFGIIDYLESQWKALVSHNADLQDIAFCRMFHEFKMRGVVAKASGQKKKTFMKKFVSDIVKNLYHPGTDKVEETELVSAVLFDFTMKNFQQVRDQDDFEDGDEIAVMYVTFKKFSHKLEILSEVLQCCPEILLKNQQKWIADQEQEQDFVLHVLAFKDTLALLKQMAENIQDARICVEWIDLARAVKKLYSLVTNDVKDEETVKEINKDWNPLRLLDLLLLQLLPPTHVDNVVFKRFVKAIAPQAKLFWKGTARADPRSQNFLKIVLNVLKKCSGDIEIQLLLNWKDSKCKVCKKAVKKPTFLPCRHFGCENCILRHLVPDQTGRVKCPICNAEVPDDFTPTPKELDEDGQEITKQTKSNCTSFFLEYLRQFCLCPDQDRNVSLQMEPQLKLIIKYLIIEDRDDRPELDPSGLDMNINFKSCVLQLLHDYDQRLLETEIDRYLQESEFDIQQSLVCVVIKTFLRTLSVKSEKLSQVFGKMTRYWEATLRKSWKTLKEEHAEMNLNMIQEIVEVRNALCHFSDVIEVVVNGKKQDKSTQKHIDRFVDLAMIVLLRSSNALKEFVLKCGNKKYGLQWLKQVSNHDKFKDIIPPYLKQAITDRSADFWVLLGREYVETKSQIYQNDPADYETEAAAIFDQHQGENPLPHALAVMSWANGKDVRVQQKLIGVLQHKCGNLVNFLNLLSHSDQTLLGIIERNVDQQQQASALFQTVAMALVTLTTSQCNMLQGFNQIIQNVQTVQGLYLPTMQEHRFFSTPAEFRNENQQTNSMYTCPKGHLYSIGNCTRPVMEAVCPECKSRIGGSNYKSAAGNQKVIITTQSQSGYKRNTEEQHYCTGAERMTLQGHAAVQFILHSSLLAASLNNPGAVAAVLGVRDLREAQLFLVQQLQQNIKDLAKGLAKNTDDAAYIMIRVLMRMQQVGQANHAPNWSSMDNRKAWEQAFRQEYLLPIFQNIDNELNAAAQAAAQEGEALTGALLTRMLQDMPPTDDDNEDEEVVWQSPSLWMVVEHKDATHLMQKLENSADETTGQVLKVILKSRNLEYLKYLENILTLQQKLVETYQYKLDLGDADEKMTLRDHVEKEEVRDEEFVQSYINAWNDLYPTLKGVAPDFLNEFFKPLTWDCPLSMALPSVRGRGQCAKLLAEYLIETQNDFLNECISIIKPQQELKEVEIQRMTSSDFLCIDKEKDFIEMIDMHTSYRIHMDREKGREHFTNYNFEALEKQTLPCMRYLQDVGIGDDWRKVESTIPQEPLTAKLCQDIDGAVEKAHSADVCEKVRTLSSAIRFLAMVKTEPKKLLHEFLQDDLRLPTARTTIIPRSAQLQHVLSIYQRLTWHKAIIFIKRNLDPYKEALSAITQEDIPLQVLNKTKEAFARTDIPKLQQKMNEMLITGTGIDDANWSLVEDVFPVIDDEGDESWYGKLPEELCNKHISHLFKETVKFKGDTD